MTAIDDLSPFSSQASFETFLQSLLSFAAGHFPSSTGKFQFYKNPKEIEKLISFFLNHFKDYMIFIQENQDNLNRQLSCYNDKNLQVLELKTLQNRYNSILKQLEAYKSTLRKMDLSYKAEKDIRSRLEQRKRGRALSLHKVMCSLDDFWENKDDDFLQACRGVSEYVQDTSLSLSYGLLGPRQIQTLNLTQIMERVLSLFSGKISHERLNASFSHTHPSLINGDVDYIELILTNVISRSVYFLPPKGFIDIKVQSLTHAVEIEICDNGYSIVDNERENVLRRSPLYISDDILNYLCEENSIIYQSDVVDKASRRSRLHIHFSKDLEDKKFSTFLLN